MSKECPICHHDNALDATHCEICGSLLTEIQVTYVSDNDEIDLFGNNIEQTDYTSESEESDLFDAENIIKETENQSVDRNSIKDICETMEDHHHKFIDLFNKPIDTDYLVSGYIGQIIKGHRNQIQNDCMKLIMLYVKENLIYRLNGEVLHKFINRRKGYRQLQLGVGSNTDDLDPL